MLIDDEDTLTTPSPVFNLLPKFEPLSEHLSSLKHASFSRKLSLLRTLGSKDVQNLTQAYRQRLSVDRQYVEMAREVREEYESGRMDPVNAGCIRKR